jgi:hypothetical protein
MKMPPVDPATSAPGAEIMPGKIPDFTMPMPNFTTPTRNGSNAEQRNKEQGGENRQCNLFLHRLAPFLRYLIFRRTQDKKGLLGARQKSIKMR